MSWIRTAALVCAASAATLSYAQESAPLSFEDAARKTLASHPQFESLSLVLQAARARAEVDALRPPLEIGAEVENVAGTGALSGADAAEITVSLSSIFERGGKRAARMDAGARAVELLSIEQRVEMLDLLAETGRRFVAAAVAQDAVTQAQERAGQARRTLDLIAPRVAAARSPPTERLNAEIDLRAAELAAADARREQETAQYALASLWAAPQETPNVRTDIYAVSQPRAFEALSAELDQLPDLGRFAAADRLREAEIRLARAQALADWRWSVGVRRLEEFNEQALVFGFSLPINNRQRNAPLIRQAELSRAQASLDAKARRLELLPVLRAQWQQLLSAREATLVIADEQLPRAREALELTRRGYEIGRFPYRELALAQQQVLALEAQRLQAAAQYHLTRIEIDRLTGAQLALLEGQKP